MQSEPAAVLPRWVVDDRRQMRAYPDQPPVIPHSIEGYELSVNANRCLVAAAVIGGGAAERSRRPGSASRYRSAIISKEFIRRKKEIGVELRRPQECSR
jgi:hypothetical protein